MAGAGEVYSFSDTTTTKRTVSNFISLITPQDIPCISYFGTNNQSKFKMQNFPNHKYEWLEDTLRPRAATLNEAMDTTETGMDVSSGHGVRFKIGDVWRSDETGELILVTAVTAGSDTVTTVIRNWNNADGSGAEGTAGSSITNGTGLTYLFNTRLEGADSDASTWTTPTSPYNYSQILQQEIKVSGSEQDATSRYGLSDQYEYQLKKWLGGAGSGGGRQGRAGDLMIDLENTFFYGQKVQRTSTVRGAMGGFEAFVTSNISSNSGTARVLTQKLLEDQLQNIWSAGGMPDVIICNAFQKRLISSFYSGSVRTERTERTGGVVIDTIQTEFGNYDVMLNRRAPTNKVYIAERAKMGWVTLRDWFVHPLAVTGDFVKSEIVGEFGFVVLNESAHGYIKDLTTS
jgi:hypothetical protein